MKRIINAIFLKLTLLTFLLAFFNVGFSVYAQEKNQFVIIKGTINGDTKGFNKVYCYGDGIPEDLEQEIKNGTFEFKIKFERPFYPLFFTEYDKKVKGGYRPFGVLIDKPGLVEIIVENIDKGFNGASVAGLQSALLDQAFKKEKSKIYEQIFELTKKQHGKSWVPDDDPKAERINKSTDSLVKMMFYPYVLKFIKEHKDSYVSILYLNEYKDAVNFNEVVETYNGFSEELKTSTYGRSISDYLEGVNNSQIGSIAKSFTLLTNDSTAFNFDQLKGRYIVLDFWASWCGPCRESFPHMREIYAKYKEKGIQFLNISIDKNKSAWLKAVAKENNPWTQLLDDKDVSLKLFGVTSVPTTYLIDTEGKIVAKEIGFSPSGNGEIESKLKLLFGF